MSHQLRIDRCPDLEGLTIWEVLGRVGADEPLLFLGGDQSPYSLLALSFDEEGRDDFMLSEVEANPQLAADAAQGLPITLGQVALLTYDAYNPWCGRATAPCRFFHIRRALVWNKASGEVLLTSEPTHGQARHQIAWPLVQSDSSPLPPQSVDWKSSWNDSQYLEAVAQSLEDIRDGRFYQINILRYWRHQGEISRQRLLRRLKKFGGPFSAFIDLPDLGLVSWSPERFVQIKPKGGKSFIEAEPIKGTRPVVNDPATNKILMDELQSSAKDKAELHMIVDLMRNDLQRISVPRSVAVIDPGSLRSFPNVHHLVARVLGEMKPGLRLDEVCRALCPGGSITGAPKREVMSVIHNREERERGYFMGNIWYKDYYSGCIDSSILIRTAVRQSRDSWEYAAGSGITVKSHAYEELQEVLTKARIILENPW